MYGHHVERGSDFSASATTIWAHLVEKQSVDRVLQHEGGRNVLEGVGSIN